ncbi:YceD family protein [Psychrobacillus sp. FSL H8-0483]|uniref:YceD family protein n=1 Tax=Psychrobacillus sp. FSL H8-0483 TaxID=2921389 RepID=UPI0031599A42
MKWVIHQLAKYRENGMTLDEFVVLENVEKRNHDVRNISPVHVKGHCTFGAAQMTCHLQLSGTLILPCARTWEDVEYPFEIETVEVFNWSETALALASAQTNDNFHIVEGDVIHVDPVLEELVLLEIPMQVYKEGADQFKHEGGNGWSYTTDEDLNDLQEDDQPKLDPRLAELAKYFDQTDE